jgi:hypothetical protein
MKKPMTPFNVLFTDEERNALDALTAARSESRAQVLRSLIRAAHLHHCMDAPTCANGSPCFVPQMHYARRPALPAPADAAR